MNKLLPKSANNPKGFTLIELMVVVSIIAFLAVIGVAAFSNAQKQARDGRRRADIEAIAAAAESNYVSTSTTPYPALATLTGGSLFSSSTLPKDPTDVSPYQYNIQVPADRKTFTVCVRLENDGTGNAGDGGNGVTFSTTSPLHYYCIRSRQ